MTLHNLMNIVTFSSLFFLAVITLYKKNSTLNGYRFLSVFLIFLSFIFADEAFSHSGLYNYYPLLTIVFQPTIFAIAPTFYLAVIYLTTINKKIYPTILLHFIPFFVILVLYFFVYLLTNSDKRPLPNNASNTKHIDLVFLLLLFIQIFIYIFFSFKQLKKHKQTLALFISNLSANDYNWLYKIVIGLSILTLIWFAESFIDEIQISFYFSFIYLIGVYYIGVQIINQKDVFPFSKEQNEIISTIIIEADTRNNALEIVDANYVDEQDDKTAGESKTAKKQVLSAEKLQQYKEQLFKLMETDKPYLDSGLSYKTGKWELALFLWLLRLQIHDCPSLPA